MEQFAEDLKGKAHSSSPSAHEEGSSGVVTDLLTAKPKEKALLAHPNIAVGGRFVHKDHGGKIFELKKIEDDGAFFVQAPIFGMPVEVKAGLDALNEWKKTKTEPQVLLESNIVKKRLPHNAPAVAEEALKAEAQHLLFQAAAIVQHYSFEDLEPCPEDPGTHCPYFAIKSTDDSDLVNMHITWVQYEGLRLPILENQDGLGEETYLYRGQVDLQKKDQVEGQAKKRQKR